MRYIFIGGAPRSGTTLLQKMLVLHPKIGGGPEFDNLNRIVDLYRHMTSDGQLQRHSFYHRREDLQQQFCQFVDSLFSRAGTHKPGAAALSEKSLTNAWAADVLLRWFPDAWYIDVIRDGRDVYLSHKKVWARLKEQIGADAAKRYRPEYALRRIARMWKGSIDQYWRLTQDADVSSRVLQVKYEDLVASPEQIIKPVLSSLAFEYMPHVTHPEEYDASSLGFSANVDGVWYTEDSFNQPISPSSVGKWRRELNRQERMMANLLMADHLLERGYSVSKSMVKLRRRLTSLRDSVLRRPKRSPEDEGH